MNIEEQFLNCYAEDIVVVEKHIDPRGWNDLGAKPVSHIEFEISKNRFFYGFHMNKFYREHDS